ncbi:MAG: glycogen(starch) synthase [Lentimonas sp.]|jgi:glycogen(starch) synthase
MKILVISNLYPPLGIGGYEERCLHTVECLRARGHHVHVLTSNHKLEQSNTSDENQIHRKLRIHGFFGHPWLPIHKLYLLEKTNQLILRELLRTLEIDVVHIWNMGGLSKSLLHSLEAQSIPVVYDISDHWIARSLIADVWLSWWNRPGSICRSLLRNLLTVTGLRTWIQQQVPTAPVTQLKFKQIYFCSDFMRRTTAGKGYPVEHAKVIHCGVEQAQFKRKTAFHPPRNFIWVGRLAQDKDPMTALKGFLEARQLSQLPLTLDIYGRGEPEYTAQIQDEIKRAGAQACVRLKSAPHAEIRTRYAQYDGYIFSSNWGEPFALTPLEAMSAGLPVIMCPDGGDAELLADGTNALGFEAGSASSLAQAILRLLQLPDYGQSISASAHQEITAHFTVEIMTDQIEATLQRASDTQNA